MRRNDHATAIQKYLDALQKLPGMEKIIASNLTMARRRYRASRNAASKPRVGVCGWELSHNAAGRMYTLAMLYETFAEVEIVGCHFPSWGREVWGPIRDTAIPKHSFVVEYEAAFVDQALQLVAAHPYDIVHLSKPRAPNIIFGLLYKLIWDAKVLIDIDDEELAFVGAENPIAVEDYLKQHDGQLPNLKDLAGKEWTRLAVGLAKEFDGLTVCNSALQQRYGGEIIPHARDDKKPSSPTEFKRQNRKKFGIPQDKKVVLFFGTPRKHKGLLETAEAIGGLKRSDITFCVVGDFLDITLKKKLQEVKGCEFLFLPDQPFKDIPNIVSMADCCVLIQDETQAVSHFQTPAKISDAFVMELLVLAKSTPTLKPLIEAGAVVPISESTFQSTLSRCLDNVGQFDEVRQRGRRYFEEQLSLKVEQGKLLGLVQRLSRTSSLASSRIACVQSALFNDTSGWKALIPVPTEVESKQPSSTSAAVSAPVALAQEKPTVTLPQVKNASLPASQAALVIHVYHLDTLSDLSKYAANFPATADQFVTCPDSFDQDQLNLITKALPRARIVKVPNAGQDVGALIALAEQVDIVRYEVICKIHSKKGAKEPARWRHALLRGVLASPKQVNTILDAFKNDPKLMLAGAQQLYLHGPTYMWKNAENLGQLFGQVVGSFDYIKQDWGFIAGTCFWIRGSALAEIKAVLPAKMFAASTYTDDGTIAHSVERIFGMIATLRGGKTLLSDVVNPERHTVVQAGFPTEGVRSRIMISDLLRGIKFPDALAKTWTPRGGLNGVAGAMVKGWLALLGDPLPRRGILKIETHTIPFFADVFRDDLKNAAVNAGVHAFQVQVPAVLCDEKEHEVILIDEATGLEIAKRSCRWENPKRDYWDFQGFLKSSMTQPEIQAPFQESDKRSFATMEVIANQFCRRALSLSTKPLVTVVMPMFNRASVVNVSIASVLSQTYSNFELLVVDDGSSDNSVEVVRAIGDSRIKVIELGQNRGVTVARNAALCSAKGSIVAYLDSDNTWDPRFLAAHVGALDQLPDADMIYSGVLLYIGNATNPYAMRYGHLHRALLENKNYIDNNIIVHRHSFLTKIGGFDENLKRYVDWDLILRSTEIGRVYSVPMLLCHYYYGKTDNAITDNPAHTGHLQVLKNNLASRRKDFLRQLDAAELTRPVGVIIPSWQALDDIRDCIEALSKHDWKGLLEIIVVDNDSTNNVKTYLQKEKAAGRIRLRLLDTNYGFTYAVNIGIEMARPDADIVLLNNDAIALPGAIQSLQRACLKRPNAGMTVPRQILPAGTKTLRTHVPFARETDDCDVNISAHHRNIADVPVLHDGGDLELTYAAFFSVYIRREVIDQIGSLDAEYGRHYRSDRVYADLMRNLTHYRMFYAPESHFIHKLQKSTDQLRDTGEKNGGFELMFKRNQWDAKTAEQLGYTFAAWDIF